jgi:hypothetical protein
MIPSVLAVDGATPARSGLGKGLAEECVGVATPERVSPDHSPSPAILDVWKITELK